MELLVWQRAWKLPSFDYKCIIAQTFIRFQNPFFKFQYCNNPWKSLNGDFPILKMIDLPDICGYDEIIKVLQTNGYNVDTNFSSQQRSFISAYKSLLEEKLFLALEFLMWVDSKGFTELTRPTFANILPFPLGLYTPIAFRNKIVKKLQIIYNDLPEAEQECIIIKEAKEALNMISNKLESKDYFLGSKPCSLDAYIYAFLAVVLKANMPNPVLTNHVRACPNLVYFFDRINVTYFPPTEEELAEERKIQEEKSKNKLREKPDDFSEFPDKRRNMAIAGVVCLGSILVYSVVVGLLKVQIIRPDGIR